MSRAFSSTTAAVKSLKWLPVKTTKPIDWIKRGVEEYLDTVEANYPQLASTVGKVTVGEIRGNPHPTPHQKGPNDPFHGSGVIGGKNLKRDDRETSLHIYPNGVVKPTNEKWPTLQVTAATAQELGEDAVWLDPNYCEEYASGSKATAVSSSPGEWEWDTQNSRYRRWNSKDWEWAPESSSSGAALGSKAVAAASTSPGEWEWDRENGRYKRWNGKDWEWALGSAAT